MPFATSYKVNIQSTRRCNVAFHKHTDDADLFQTASCTDRQSLTSPQYSDMKSFFSQDSFRKMPHPATSDGAINRCCGTQNKINRQTYSCLDIGMPLHCLHSSSLYYLGNDSWLTSAKGVTAHYVYITMTLASDCARPPVPTSWFLPHAGLHLATEHSQSQELERGIHCRPVSPPHHLCPHSGNSWRHFFSSDNGVNNTNYCVVVLKCLALSTTLILANWTEH